MVSRQLILGWNSKELFTLRQHMPNNSIYLGLVCLCIIQEIHMYKAGVTYSKSVKIFQALSYAKCYLKPSIPVQS